MMTSQPQKTPNNNARDYTAAFSLRFRMLMAYHDLTLREIAQETGNAISTVGTWKNGRIPSRQADREKLAEILGVSVDFLLTGRSGATAGGTNPPINTASRVLKEIDVLLRELGDGDVIREPMEAFDPESIPADAPEATKVKLKRYQIEQHFAKFLDEAERYPDGLSYAWVHMQTQFPQNRFNMLGAPATPVAGVTPTPMPTEVTRQS